MLNIPGSFPLSIMKSSMFKSLKIYRFSLKTNKQYMNRINKKLFDPPDMPSSDQIDLYI